MIKLVYRVAILFLLAANVTAAPAPAPRGDKKIKDRKGFIPFRKYHSLPGKTIGLLVSDVRAKMSHEGRSGPPNAMAFSQSGGSYRWVYVPANGRALITNLRVPICPDGKELRLYPRLDMANSNSVQQWKINAKYALVEVEVNDGLGAPAEEGFVATQMKRLDGTKAFPLNVEKVVADIQERYQTWQKKNSEIIEKEMRKAEKTALDKEKRTGPRKTETLMYLTWLPKEQRVRVHFQTKITDGAYKYTQGGARPIRPFPLPVPPRKGIKGAPPPPAAAAAFPPPPPPRFKVRYGKTCGIVFGRAYEIDRNGTVRKSLSLEIEAFQKVLPPPPQVGFPRRPIDPLPPIKRR